MAKFLIQEAATFRLDQIYRYTLSRWGVEQAESYIEGLFDAFSRVGEKSLISRPIPAEFGVNGFYIRYKKHFVYWKYLNSGDVGIVTTLHERMHQIGQFKDAGN